VEALKAAAGAEYEGVLEAALTAIGVPFASEADLRADGFARTPVRMTQNALICGAQRHI
jgi:hypothetical protein